MSVHFSNLSQDCYMVLGIDSIKVETGEISRAAKGSGNKPDPRPGAKASDKASVLEQFAFAFLIGYKIAKFDITRLADKGHGVGFLCRHPFDFNFDASIQPYKGFAEETAFISGDVGFEHGADTVWLSSKNRSSSKQR